MNVTGYCYHPLFSADSIDSQNRCGNLLTLRHALYSFANHQCMPCDYLSHYGDMLNKQSRNPDSSEIIIFATHDEKIHLAALLAKSKLIRRK